MRNLLGRQFWHVLRIVAVIGVVATTLFVTARALANVTVSSFQAQGQPTQILVTWSTATEINNVGFNLLRSTMQNGTYTQINPSIIPSQCLGCIGGANYSYADTTVILGQTYYYHLQSVDNKGNTETFICINQCPVMAIAGAPTPTPTPTNTPPPTRTATATRPPPTTTRTLVPPTATNTLPPNTPLPTATALLSTVAPTATPTDLPAATDSPIVAPNSDGESGPTAPAPMATKFAAPVSPSGPDQLSTPSPSATLTASGETTATPAPTELAIHVVRTPAPTDVGRNLKGRSLPSPERRWLGMTENKVTVIAVTLFAFGLAGLGVISGLVALSLWYLGRSY